MGDSAEVVGRSSRVTEDGEAAAAVNAGAALEAGAGVETAWGAGVGETESGLPTGPSGAVPAVAAIDTAAPPRLMVKLLWLVSPGGAQ
jgi:hypothetical protein